MIVQARTELLDANAVPYRRGFLWERGTRKTPLFSFLPRSNWSSYLARNCLRPCAAARPNRGRQHDGSAMKRSSRSARIFASETRPPMQLASSRFKTSDPYAGRDSIVALIVTFARRCKIHAQRRARESVAWT